MIQQFFEDIYSVDLAIGAYIHDAYIGFKEDYMILHCLLRKYKPTSVMETGTNIGSGILVIHAALPYARIFSIDLDYATMRLNSAQYPLDADGTDRVGSAAREVIYTQLRGDTLTFDFSYYPCEAWYIDAEHDTLHAYHESMQAIKQNAKLIIWHDSDMPEVMEGIKKAMATTTDYGLYRVIDTRIAYAIKTQ